MHTAPNWNYKPYIPLFRRKEDEGKPYICRLAPGENRISGEVSKAPAGTVFHRERGGEHWLPTGYTDSLFIIDGLQNDTDYELYIKAPEGESAVRLARTSSVPGTVVNYLHPEDKVYAFSGSYLCSPSIVKLPSGKIITSMDIYEGGTPQNLTLLMKSEDGGNTFSYLNELFPLFWAKLFWHKGALYAFGTSTEYGDLLIGKSLDEGETWSQPTVIERGSCDPKKDGFHRAPTVFLNENGMLLTAVEYGCRNDSEFKNALVFAKEDADLLDADSWTVSPFLPLPDQAKALFPQKAGAIEGNLVMAPDGKLINFLRFELNTAVLLKADINHPESGFEFYKTIEFPMGHTKFEIQQKDSVYYAVGNRPPKRNILSLYTSKDLINWTLDRDILNYETEDMTKVAFQYPVFAFDGGDMLVLSRTAFGGAHSFHDSNYQTLHRITL